MAGRKSKRSKTVWGCTECGGVTSGWFGRCPDCGAWNSIVEHAESASPDRVVLAAGETGGRVIPSTEAQQRADELTRLPSHILELDRVLGGGLVPGSVVLLGGPPGIGKSTLLLQACAGLARSGRSVLYASGEESVTQVAGRATRLSAADPSLLLMAETRVESILAAALEHTPAVVVIDSVQTVYSDATEGLPGNLSQIRAVTAQLLGHAKTRNVPVVIVGHVTKDGQIAGPRLLEHMVDAVLSFEGDEERSTRLLRASKNRFGSTQELGVFEMTGAGLTEISNPSEAFLSERAEQAVGSCVTATLEGSRPLLLEVQALIGGESRGSPRRTSVGADHMRLSMLLAVLDRHAGLAVLESDVFVNVAGGMRVTEPAADLAMLLAIASSHRRKPLPPSTLAVGEIGLTGELRRVPRLEARVAEAHRLGFRRIIAPAGKQRIEVPADVQLVRIRHVADAVDQAMD